MNLRALATVLSTCVILVSSSSCSLAQNDISSGKPNIILILADDYGWKDSSCYGSEFYQTPNLDKLAADGARFTQAYAACPVCSPSRAALLTGKYPARLRVTDWIPGQMPENPKLLVPDWTKHLPLEERTLPEALKEHGYATASIGKWHLGGEEFYPEKHGFDVNLGGTDMAHTRSYFAPYNIETLEEGPAGEYITDRLTSEALGFIESNRERPFFLYIPHFAVHTPIAGKRALIEKYRARIRAGASQKNAAYAAMIESMDEGIGQLRAKLEELKLAERTIIIFASDNGGRIPTTSNQPLRAGKGSCYEGGVRVPFVVYWPGVTKAGSIVETPTISNDVFPTVLEMLGRKAGETTDGVSLVPLLKGEGDVKRDALYWHYPHYQHYQQGGATPYGAIRAGDFKLIEFYDDMRVELYNLRDDIDETKDLAATNPEKADELRKRLHAWRAEVGAQMPTPNPDYDASRPEHDPATRQRKPIVLVPEKVPSIVPDQQEAQVPDRVKVGGWIGQRITANEVNRLAKIDPDRLLEGYRKRPGRQTWDGEHIGKWMHAATLAWANTGNRELREKLDYVAVELVKCQLADGYLGTYSEDQRWSQWDVWAHKYNLLGLITYMRHTGNLDPLPACERMADLLINTFGDEPGKRDIILAGQHMGMAPTSVLEPMVLLYRLTGEQRHLGFCKYLLRAWEQPNGPKIVSTLIKQKRVDKVGNAKAYEMLSCLNGALEYHRTVGDQQLLDACLIAWDDIVKNRLYPTGAASYREFFHGNNDFPNVNNVGETCVTVTWLQFNAQLLRLTGEARFAEQLERVVLNQLMGAQKPDGSAWGYYVQMEGIKPYNGTLDGHCCLSSGPRGVALIPTFAMTTDDEGVVVNLFEKASAKLPLKDGTSVTVECDTRFPNDEVVKLTVSAETAKPFAVKFRIPDWAANSSILVNGKQMHTEPTLDGYRAVRRAWKPDDVLIVRLKLEPHVLAGTHRNANKVALTYGPLVLAADEALLASPADKLTSLGVTTTSLKALNIRAKAAEGKHRTWAGAQVFEVDGVVRKPGLGLETGSSATITLRPFADAGATSDTYQVWLPSRDVPSNWNLLYDGIETRSRKPNFGSIIDGDPQNYASTQTGKPAKVDSFAVDLAEPRTIQRVVFTHGVAFPNGGWFDTSVGKPRVEIKAVSDGPWQPLAVLEEYPSTTATNAGALEDGAVFTCKLPTPVEVAAIRVIGKPASGKVPDQAFVTCGELEAYGPAAQK